MASLQDQLSRLGLESSVAAQWAAEIDSKLKSGGPSEAWLWVSKKRLTSDHPFDLHLSLFHYIYRSWKGDSGPPPAWMPEQSDIEGSHLEEFRIEKGLASFQACYEWSIQNREEFWRWSIQKLEIFFQRSPDAYLDLSKGVESARWLKGAKLNISESCFSTSENHTALVAQQEGGALEQLSYGELDRRSNQVANGLVKQGFYPGDAIAIDMTMNAESVVIYLGIVKAGGAVVSIADSFAPAEISTRLQLANAKAIFTQDYLCRGKKKIPLYEKVAQAKAPRAIVLSTNGNRELKLREGDLEWKNFLSDNAEFSPVSCDPEAAANILFSSGTTGNPKAIPWTHTTPIKCAVDGYFHHDIHPGDRVAWPSNLGWMMGPWLIFASLINRATMCLYSGLPTDRGFGEFVQNARVNMLGLVPSLVKAWRDSNCMAGLDWSAIKVFSSTGECSNAEDYLYLMSRANYRPVIEYCGGTEIGGGYISGTVVQPASPGTFSTPCLGLELVLLDETRRDSKRGEVFLGPPSIGLSERLLHRDHDEVYYKGVPAGPKGQVLRRHGDQMERLGGGYYRGEGRADDTMNLGGIKVSSAEIERTVNVVEGVHETAAIAWTPEGGGPSLLVLYVVLVTGPEKAREALKVAMQSAIKKDLNPLFKIHDVVLVDALPRTASNKVMRRVLRQEYGQSP